MKAFISQPMKGKTTEQILEERATLEKNLKKLGYDVIPLHSKEVPDNVVNSGAYMLGASIQEMSTADVVFFMPRWNFAHGCKQEMSVCKVYNIATRRLGVHDALLMSVED